MLTIPNAISLIRLPLALLFLQHEIAYRAWSIILAMISDGLDGFLARRYQQSTKIGTLLDPLMDRFFVFFVIGILLQEGQLAPWQACTLLCRDISVILFGFYLVFTGKLTSYRFRAIWCGKATTFLQFVVFLALTFQFSVPSPVYFLFVFLGVLALVELYISKESTRQYSN